MRMPSASLFQRSAFLLSSSSAVLEYVEKSCPELPPRLDSSRDGRFVAASGSRESSISIRL